MLKNAIGLFTLTVLVLIFFLPSFTVMQEKRQRNAEYDEQVKRLERKKLKMMTERHLLEKDPVYLEKVAREKMGLIKEGEVVYKMDHSEDQKK